MAATADDAPGALSPPNEEPQSEKMEINTGSTTEALTSNTSDRKGSIAATLPQEVIEQILHITDPETFCSLILLNRVWRKSAEDPQIYAHQLSQCPSYSPSHSALSGPFDEDSLLRFKRLLVQEAKRHLFEVFLRPQKTTINLISTTTSSSAAFPYGEKFEFIFAPRAQFCLAMSSSRIIVLDTASAEVTVKRELKVVRRPLSACILHTGTLLAVLTTPHKVNMYDLTEEKPKLLKSLELEGTSHNITMSLRGEVLAAANEAGVEVVSLGENALPTEKRGVKCDRVDNLSFSCDGTMLLGTTQNSKNPSTVVLSAPYFTDAADHDMDHAQLISHMWTSQIIFPNSSRDCSHAALLPRNDDHNSNWTLTYDRTFESFRAVRTDDLRNGTTYFTGPNPRRERERLRSKSLLVPNTLPTITPAGELVAAAFLGKEIWLYGVPENLDNTGVKYENARAGDIGSSSIINGSESPNSPRNENETLPRWQVLVDKYRNVFAKGRRIAEVSGATNICWHIATSDEDQLQNIRERLVVAAPGGLSGTSDLEHEGMLSLDGGRLVCLDFNWSPQSGASKEITIEVGSAEPQLLEEESTDMATEIAIVRRRTVARREGIPRSMVASVVDVLRPADEEAPPVPPVNNSVGFGLDHTANETPPTATDGEGQPSPPSSAEGVTMEEAAQAFDGPYSHTDPRSRTTLYRSATAVEANRRRNPPTIPSSGRVEFRRTDGTELPHESDADNWVPPPPPYTKEAVDPLPHHLRHILISQSSITPMASTNDNATPSPPNESSQENSGDTTDQRPPSRVSSEGPSNESTSNSREPSLDNSVQSRPVIADAHFDVRSSPSIADAQDSTVTNENATGPRSPPPLTIPRRPVPKPNAPFENRLSTITDASGRRRSLADASRDGTNSPSWLSRHDSNRSNSPETRRQDLSRSASQRHAHSSSSTPSSPSPASTSRRPLSSYEPRSSLYRAALQPASSISPIQEPVLPPQARIPANRSSISSQASTRRSTSLTLSGSNLQQRLDYPLPPPPGSEKDEGEPSSPDTARSNSVALSGRDISPIPPNPAVHPLAIEQPVHESSADAPSQQINTIPTSQTPSQPPPRPVSQLVSQPISQPTPRPTEQTSPLPRPTRELSAYEQMQQQMQNLPPPPPPPVSSSPNPGGDPRRRSSRFRSPFRLSAAVSSTNRPMSRTTSSSNIQSSGTETHSQQTQHQQPLVTSQTTPVTDLSRTSTTRGRSKNRLSRRLSRVFHGDSGNKETTSQLPPVPPVPSSVAEYNLGTQVNRKPTRRGSRSGYARRGAESSSDAWQQVAQRQRDDRAWQGGQNHMTTEVVGGGKKKGQSNRDKDGKCIVM